MRGQSSMRTIVAFAGQRASSRRFAPAPEDDDEPISLRRAVAIWAAAAFVGWGLTVGLVWATTTVSGG